MIVAAKVLTDIIGTSLIPQDSTVYYASGQYGRMCAGAAILPFIINTMQTIFH